MDSANRSTASAEGRFQPGARKRANSKRDKIVRSAAKLFLEKGYDNVSINDIIDVVGGSKGTIYSNFGSKEKLFEAVVEQMCSDVTVRIDTRLVGTVDEQLTRIAQVVRLQGAVAANPVVSQADDLDRAGFSARPDGCSTTPARAPPIRSSRAGSHSISAAATSAATSMRTASRSCSTTC